MRKTSKVQGTKIAQAAKDLSVTSVTIRRYVSEFGIDTTTDENGIKVLPDVAMDELKEVRRLKEEGYTNPMVLEFLEDKRAKRQGGEEVDVKPEKTRAKGKGKGKAKEAQDELEDDSQEVEAVEEEAPQSQSTSRQVRKRGKKEELFEEEGESEESAGESTGESAEEETQEQAGGEPTDGRLKHSLTCQTCGKSFEHLNPKLRDCLDCYRAKRKERRRGGDRHKNVIQHPLAQQVASKMANQQQQQQQQQEQPFPQHQIKTVAQPAAQTQRKERELPQPGHSIGVTQPVIGGLKTQVRSYRKAIEETRQITGSLKRRLERPDLPEGDRRWLEQIYAYQLILHQGWRHLSEYRATTQQQAKLDD